MSNIEITPELLAELRKIAIKAKEAVEGSNKSVILDFSEPEKNLIFAANPDVVLGLVAEIERLRKALMAIHELERKRWESAVKAFGTISGELQRGSRNDSD